MADFRKVTGAQGVETNLDFLRSEVARLSQHNALLNQELVSRAVPRAAEIMDSLQNLIAVSRAGNPQAKQVLKNFFEILDAARAESSSLTVVRANGGSPS